MRIISIATVTSQRISRMLMVTHHLPRFVKLSRFQSFLAVHPNIIDAFRLQLWNQLPDSSKLGYLQSREDASARWFCQYAHEINVKSATTFRDLSSLRCSFGAWCKFHQGVTRIQLQQRTVSLRKCKTSILWWHSYTTQQRISHARSILRLSLVNVQLCAVYLGLNGIDTVATRGVFAKFQIILKVILWRLRMVPSFSVIP